MVKPQVTELHARTKYLDDDAHIETGLYADGSTAIRLYDADLGEPLAVATVCLSEYGLTPAPGNVFIKDWSENEGMYACLVREGVVGEPVAVHKVGWNDTCTAYECPLLVEP